MGIGYWRRRSCSSSICFCSLAMLSFSAVKCQWPFHFSHFHIFHFSFTIYCGRRMLSTAFRIQQQLHVGTASTRSSSSHSDVQGNIYFEEPVILSFCRLLSALKLEWQNRCVPALCVCVCLRITSSNTLHTFYRSFIIYTAVVWALYDILLLFFPSLMHWLMAAPGKIRCPCSFERRRRCVLSTEHTHINRDEWCHLNKLA